MIDYSGIKRFIYDDITWCGSECDNTDCHRHHSNMMDKTGLHSYANFKGTDICPDKEDNK